MSDDGSLDRSEDGSYEVVDYSEHPLFLILSAVLQDEAGNTICDHLARLTEAINRNTAAIENKNNDHVS